jgi:hypothetical protein
VSSNLTASATNTKAPSGLFVFGSGQVLRWALMRETFAAGTIDVAGFST